MRLHACLALALAGCAAQREAPQPPPLQIERLAPARFGAPALAAVALEVRGPAGADMKSVEELREMTERFTGYSVGLSGVAAAEAALLPGFFSGSLVAGGLILAPLAIGLDATQRRQHDIVVGALKQADFLALTRESLARRLPGGAREPVLSVVVLAYGLVPKVPGKLHTLCLALDAEIVVRSGERELFRDPVYLEPWRRSADAPPPVCASMESFAANDGLALRNAVQDYAQVLAAIARHRTPALPWTP